MAEEKILKVENLSVRFDERAILKNLSFEIEKGDSVAIIGPNGAGKTVLFRALLGLVPYEGKILWKNGTKIGYVPQRLSVDRGMPLTVAEFLSFKKASREEFFEALDAAGISDSGGHRGGHHVQHHVLDNRLGNLSGGELQKILVAYAIIGHPDVLLFDEPTAGVDVEGEETIYALLDRLHRELGMTVILISHDLNVVYRYAHNVLCLNKKQICYGPSKEVLTPKALQELYGSNIKLHQHEHGR